MNQDWQVDSPRGRCGSTGRELREGEEFYSVLFEDEAAEGGFRRADYCVEAWGGVPEGAFCFFKSRVPVKQKRRQLFVDNDVLLNFFLRLADETDVVRVQFRFVLALILMRKRILRYEGSTTCDGSEVWRMTQTSEHCEHLVVNPRLTEDQIEGVSGQLGAILHGDTGAWNEAAKEVNPSTP